MRDFGAASWCKDRGKDEIVENGKHMLRHLVLLAGRQIGGGALQVAFDGRLARRLGNFRQRLHQPMHDPPAAQRFFTLVRGSAGRAKLAVLFVECRRRRNRPEPRLGTRNHLPQPWGKLARRGIRLPRRLRRGDALGHIFPIEQHFLLTLAFCDEERLERIADEIIPAVLRSFFDAVGAADDEPLGGARHGDVEKAAIFVLGLGVRAVRAAAASGTSSALRPAQIVAPPESRSNRGGRGPAGGVMVSASTTTGASKTLGAVDRHHPHFVAPDLHVALYFGAGIAQPTQEALQRRCLPALVIEREIEKFVERIVCFRSKP